MIRGIYTAAANMVSQGLRQEVISNNLANLNTTGYKGDLVVFRDKIDQALARQEQNNATPVGSLTTSVGLDDVYTLFEQGDLRSTENQLDLAIDGGGFFEVNDNGRLLYTRSGNWKRNAEGYLVDNANRQVMGQDGPIQIPNTQVTIGRDGTIYDKKTVVGRLRVVDVADPASQLEKVGGSYFRLAAGRTQPAQGQVMQGALEGPNINAVGQMVEMITAMRSYEASQRMIQAQDESLGKAISEIARG